MDKQPRFAAALEGQNVHCTSDTVRQLRWIDPGELVVKRRIGVGGYGVVEECEWSGRRVAVKTLTYEGRQILECEATLLHKVCHPNVVELIGCAFDEEQNKGMLVMELMSQDLRTLIDIRRKGRRGAPPFSYRVAVDIMRQIANGLEHLRQLRVLHRGLKSLNILVNPRTSMSQQSSNVEESQELHFDVKLSDFGRSKCNELDSLFSSIVAPPSWRAPEVFRDKDMISSKYTWSSDVYSFGMVCYEILTGGIPFEDFLKSDPSRTRTMKELHELICDGERPALPANCPRDLYDLIEECWATIPEERPDISAIHQRLSTMAV